MTAAMLTQRAGIWWPADDIVAHPIVGGDCASDVAALLTHVPGRDVIVQAGGNVGLYALALAEHFKRVFTFEPDPVNWDCLSRNLAGRETQYAIIACNAGLGAEEGVCTPREVHKNNCAAHRVDFGAGEVPVLTIDGLGLSACDCLWLDIEGAEFFALQGAANTIEAFGPTIVLEDKGLETAFYGVAPGAMHAWLAERGYEPTARTGRWDTVFRRV